MVGEGGREGKRERGGVAEARGEQPARRTEVPRAGNTGRVKPLKWSLHQSGRHNLRPMYNVPKRPRAYGLMTARIKLWVLRSMDVTALQSERAQINWASLFFCVLMLHLLLVCKLNLISIMAHFNNQIPTIVYCHAKDEYGFCYRKK